MAKRRNKKVSESLNGQTNPSLEDNSHDQQAAGPPMGSGANDLNQESTFPIVGIGASAGGLDSFKSFFRAIKGSCGMAFVLVPHLDSKRKSSLVELLSRESFLPVV